MKGPASHRYDIQFNNGCSALMYPLPLNLCAIKYSEVSKSFVKILQSLSTSWQCFTYSSTRMLTQLSDCDPNVMLDKTGNCKHQKRFKKYLISCTELQIIIEWCWVLTWWNSPLWEWFGKMITVGAPLFIQKRLWRGPVVKDGVGNSFIPLFS